MSIFTAKLSEFGEYFFVKAIFFEEVKFLMPSARYISLKNEVALKLKNELNQGKVIRLDKEKIDRTDLKLEDFDIIKPDTLDLKKSSLKTRASQRLSSYTATISALEIFGLFATAGRLMEMGFNIFTTENKEEIYLKIVETADDNIISDLEDFLEARDKYNNIWRKYKSIKEYFREIDSAEDEEELKEIVKENKGWLTE